MRTAASATQKRPSDELHYRLLGSAKAVPFEQREPHDDRAEHRGKLQLLDERIRSVRSRLCLPLNADASLGLGLRLGGLHAPLHRREHRGFPGRRLHPDARRRRLPGLHPPRRRADAGGGVGGRLSRPRGLLGIHTQSGRHFSSCSGLDPRHGHTHRAALNLGDLMEPLPNGRLFENRLKARRFHKNSLVWGGKRWHRLVGISGAGAQRRNARPARMRLLGQMGTAGPCLHECMVG